ncbi:hypothetical protein chiPu_0012210, partial [Chiloscyllium punctatum]|nr:hypothetical protein [Chiloscyllium punctatum]
CNEPELKSLAIGIHTLLGRTLAGIPAPIYFGALFDKICLKWGTSRCGGRGACRIYNSDAFRHIFLGLQVSMRGAGLLVFFIIFALLKKRFPAHITNPGTNCGTEMMSEQDKDQKSDNGDLTVKTTNSDPDKESNA